MRAQLDRLWFTVFEGGDGVLGGLPGGSAMLIDAGGDLRWPGRFDSGARDVARTIATADGVFRFLDVAPGDPGASSTTGSVLPEISIRARRPSSATSSRTIGPETSLTAWYSSARPDR